MDNNLPGSSGYHNRSRNQNSKNTAKKKPHQSKWLGRKADKDYTENLQNNMPYVILNNGTYCFVEGMTCYDIFSIEQDKPGLTWSGKQYEQHHSPRKNKRTFCVGNKFLGQLTVLNIEDVIRKLEEKKDGLLKLVQEPIEELDIFVLLIDIMEKLTKSSFEQLTLKIVTQIVNSNFMENLQIYITNLPKLSDRELNQLYWENPHQFWQNFLTLFEYIIDLPPLIALHKCKPKISSLMMSAVGCLQKLKITYKFTLTSEYILKLIKIQKKLASHEMEKKRDVNEPHTEGSLEPPESFRLLSILPTTEDILDNRPFLRKNLIKGGYQDVEHYLDVQFRLLREDCYGPLRVGINQYLTNKNSRQFDHMRVYRKVKFHQTYISSNNYKSGFIIQIDPTICKWFKNIRWNQNKRFLHGALLLLTKDDCRSFIVALVIDRDEKLLKSGKIPVSLHNMAAPELLKDESYVMFESEVFFQPYYHVLKALQHPTFPRHLAMSKYIVKTEPEPKPPAYLDQQSSYSMRINDRELKFKVLQENTWPTAAQIGLNDSQYAAYKMALTHEFAIIQGPPGTGKTFLGVKVARALLENYPTVQDARIALNNPQLNSESGVDRLLLHSSLFDAQQKIVKMRNQSCIMLLVCYTNHALDQFLEAILPITNLIVRIGGQSHNEKLTQYNIKNVHRKLNLKGSLYKQLKQELKKKVITLRPIQKSIDLISDDNIIDYEVIRIYAPESRALDTLQGVRNPLMAWLFEGNDYISYDEFLFYINMYQNDQSENHVSNKQDIRKGIILDDIDDEAAVINTKYITADFSLAEATHELKLQIKNYNLCKERDDGWMECEITMKDIIRHIKIAEEMFKFRTRRNNIKLDLKNIKDMERIDRWSLYFRWVRIVQSKYRDMLVKQQGDLEKQLEGYEEARMIEDLRVIRTQNIKVVGMTTSGAARLRKFLQELAPPIVIVEEAAEVLEAHIVTSLTENCKHLILIGDHQQLRPSASDIKLARHYDIEVSLFERMILNGMHSSRLDVQHRMRPEIAALISPHIYQHLANHPTVQTFPNVRGITKNVFFLSHDYIEEQADDNSRRNKMEGDIMLAFANYLMMQGYSSEDITILATYTGQILYMKNVIKSYARLGEVIITSVDNYQGEESKIILLSLVRNNAEGKIGFLGIENRICVALSRAREGFYMFGNIEILKKNELWNNIAKTLKSNESLGNNLTLRCENHRNQTIISSVDDFKNVPEGGCLEKCNSKLSKCCHPCTLLCHGYDREHEIIKCAFKCERMCENGHVCPLKCGVKCKPCKVLMEKILPCGHSGNVPCYQHPKEVKCMTLVPFTMPYCGHAIEKACFVSKENARCTAPCMVRVDSCGHACTRSCHILDDPHHDQYICRKSCTKMKKGCSVEKDVQDLKKHLCKKLCYEECDPCEVQVKKTIPDCGHEVWIECSQKPLRAHCKENCERLMRCGHPCKGRCARPCDPSRCEAPLEQTMLSRCGHNVRLICYLATSLKEGRRTSDKVLDELSRRCAVPCGAKLRCKHACSGTCSKCRHGALHISCTKPCGATDVCCHICESPCNKVCPPCNKQCPVKCPHNRCVNFCGTPCSPCQEKCKRACEHSKCTKLCGAKCSRAACSERCSKRLPCGHPCRGLCGESCPDVCAVCRPDSVPKDFILQPYEDDDIFIKLEDCSHIFSVKEMDMHVKKVEHLKKIPACPLCRVPIINTYRYKDIINDILQYKYKLQIERKIQIEKMRTTLNDKISKITLQVPEYLRATFKVLANRIFRDRSSDLLQQEAYLQKMKILEVISIFYTKYLKLMSNAFNAELSDHIKPICEILNNEQKLSQQLYEDIYGELKRIKAIVNFEDMVNTETYKAIKTDPEIVKATKQIRSSVFKCGVFDETESLEAVRRIQKSQEIHKSKRELMVKAMGTKMGHFKCPSILTTSGNVVAPTKRVNASNVALPLAEHPISYCQSIPTQKKSTALPSRRGLNKPKI